MHREPLLGERPGVVGQLVALADVLDLRRDLGVPAARHIRVQVVFHLVAEVAADHVEQRAAVDVGRAEQLAHVPPAAGLVLDFLFAESVGLVREMAAEDDRVRPHVADEVGQRVCGQGAQEGAFNAGQRAGRGRPRSPTRPLVEIWRSRRPTRECVGWSIRPRQRQLGQGECAGADQRPADVVLDDLLARLAGDALEVLFEVRHVFSPRQNASTSVSCTATPHSNRTVSSRL